MIRDPATRARVGPYPLFARNLYRRMLTAGMGPSDVAVRIGCSGSLVSHWLAGFRRPSATMLLLLANVLECHPTQLWEGE